MFYSYFSVVALKPLILLEVDKISRDDGVLDIDDDGVVWGVVLSTEIGVVEAEFCSSGKTRETKVEFAGALEDDSGTTLFVRLTICWFKAEPMIGGVIGIWNPKF